MFFVSLKCFPSKKAFLKASFFYFEQSIITGMHQGWKYFMINLVTGFLFVFAK